MKQNKTIIFILIFLFSLITTIKIYANEQKTTGTFYVTQSGSDDNSCENLASPCATIQGAIDKADDSDTILVATGIYTSTNENVILINKAVSISGGWNSTFSIQNERSTVDGENSRAGVWVNSGIEADIDNFIIQNGKVIEKGGGIHNEGTLIVSSSIIQNNNAENCSGAGIYNSSSLTLEWSTLYNNSCWGGGGGLFAESDQTTIINNSLINNNQATYGGGILINNGNLFVNNSTIINNITRIGESSNGGGGIYVLGSSGHQTLINNSTISYNDGSQYGGGISFIGTSGGEFIIKNSIIANNIANTNPDCSGTILSSGYNIISNSTGCSFSSTTGDQIDVDPKLGSLQDNGGPTHTQWLYQGSPAIDGGNPNGCTDHLGHTFTNDQRGYPRPLDGDTNGSAQCDIGAYEADPNNIPPPSPDSLWYVNPDGDDTENCKSSSTACATINAAINKASKGDFIYISEGSYGALSGNEVVLINKNINLSGGWNTEFTNQIGYSEINGGDIRRGITISESISAKIDRFNVNHGFSRYADGGGIYVAWRTNLVLNDSIIQNNVAGEVHPISSYNRNGGGIGMNNYGSSVLNNTTIINNQAFGLGGGLSTGESTVTLNNCKVSDNTAFDGGGIYGGINGKVTINNGHIIKNSSTSGSGGGGGIRSRNILEINDSIISNNYSYYEGGGISGSTINIQRSEISNNQAANGGGIMIWYKGNIQNSTIINNKSVRGSGGGIYCSNNLVLTNVTIALNSASTSSQYDADGGGIWGGGVQGTNVTIAWNQARDHGGGVSGYNYFINSIIAENQAPEGPDCNYRFTSQGYNILGDPSGCNYVSATGDLINVDPRFDYLIGWPSFISLKHDSPAIDAGDPNNCASTDQFGTKRPQDGNDDGIAVCDIGTYEYNPSGRVYLMLIIR